MTGECLHSNGSIGRRDVLNLELQGQTAMFRELLAAARLGSEGMNGTVNVAFKAASEKRRAANLGGRC